MMLTFDNCYFITFTISPGNYGKALVTYSDKIKEALRGASHWLFNEDYGETNSRLHFHALASYPAKLDYTTIISIWQYGNVDFRPVYNKDERSIREYLTKITRHAVKATAGKIWRSRHKGANPCITPS